MNAINLNLLAEAQGKVRSARKQTRFVMVMCATLACIHVHQAQAASPSANVPPSVTLIAPANNAVVNAPGALTLIASATDIDGTITKVDFYRDTKLIGTGTSSPYSVSISNLPVGNYTFTVEATDNSGATAVSTPVNIRVNAPPLVKIIGPSNDGTINSPATITLSAGAIDPDGAVVKVDFFEDAVLVGTATGSPFEVTINEVLRGNYTFVAVATDNDGATTTSVPYFVNVNSRVRQVYYVHADHLGTPRAITRAMDNALMWAYDNTDPFGNSTPNENPSGQGQFVLNMRESWQYEDVETGMRQNTHRDYDKLIGRYVQFDPLGLVAGQNGYSFVRNQPLTRVDWYGLLASKLSDEECAQLEKDIGLEEGTIRKLQQMMNEGKDFKDYGLAPDADSDGNRSKTFTKKSQTYQDLTNSLEGDGGRTFRTKLRLAGATLLLGFNRASAAIEKERSEIVLKDMQEIFAKKCRVCRNPN